jgi:hypothetical protein
MIMRADTDVYKKSVFQMENFIPTPQGTAQRAPGSRFVLDTQLAAARVVPFLTTGNERSLVLFSDGALKLIRNVNDYISNKASVESSGPTTITYREPIVENGDFNNGFEPWSLSPNQQEGVNGDFPLGCWHVKSLAAVRMSARYYKWPDSEPQECEATTTAEVTYPTPPDDVGNYTFTVTVSKSSDFSSPIYEKVFDQDEHPKGMPLNINNDSFVLDGGADWTGTLYIRLKLVALTGNPAAGENEYSNPQIRISSLQVTALNETEILEADLVTPYTDDDLVDLHYVQSPYDDKELVVTHPRHPPHKLFFNTGTPAYEFVPIAFVDESLSPNPPVNWQVNNYPATCGSYHGRLVLAGGQTFRTDTGDPIATVSETVWATEVGKWDTFSTETGVNPDDSIELTAVYRSPIQWVYGQKSLLIGALEYEYSASGEGIFSPGDLGVFLHSTHGSRNVQPAGFGAAVLFAADGGTKLRQMMFSDQDGGWLADDLSLMYPEGTLPAIKRLARMRNPHQMCICLLTDGTISIYHAESGLRGWSRYEMAAGTIEDLTVITDDDGLDIPYMLVRRRINGSNNLYLEAIPNWSDGGQLIWDYVSSSRSYDFATPTDTITGLDHLEGATVMVHSQFNYIGTYTVESGQIVLSNDAGGTSLVSVAVVGLVHPCSLVTLPPETIDPGAQSRYATFGVRIIGSNRPIINNERPADREAIHPIGQSTNLDKPVPVDRDT